MLRVEIIYEVSFSAIAWLTLAKWFDLAPTTHQLVVTVGADVGLVTVVALTVLFGVVGVAIRRGSAAGGLRSGRVRLDSTRVARRA